MIFDPATEDIFLRVELKNMGYAKLAEVIRQDEWTDAALKELRELVKRAQPKEEK